jgi:hypothetical protein
MRMILPNRRMAMMLLIPLLATCTGLPEREQIHHEAFGAASEDERLVTVLIDGALADTR